MVNLIIVVVILLAVYFFFKVTSFKYERVWTYLIAAIFIFLLFTFFTLMSRNDIDISNLSGFFNGGKFYVNWLWGFMKNAAKITGNVAQIDWSGNFSNATAKG